MMELRRITDHELLYRLEKIERKLDGFSERIEKLEVAQIERRAVVRFLRLLGALLLVILTLRWGDIPKLIHALTSLMQGGGHG